MAGFDIDQIMKIINSPTGAALVQGVGGAFNAAGQRQSEAADRQQTVLTREQQAAIARATALQNMQDSRNTVNNNRTQASGTVLNANKLGDEESFAAKRAALRALLPSIGQFRSGDPGAADTRMARMDTPSVMGFLSDASSANAIAGRRRQMLNVDPTAQFSDMGSMGFKGESGLNGLNEALDAYRGTKMAERTQQDTSNSDMEKQILDALHSTSSTVTGQAASQAPAPNGYEYDQNGQLKKKHALLSKIGGVLKVAAPIAAAFIPGVGPLAAMALAGGGGLLGSKMQGQSWGQSAIAGALDGASSYGAAKLSPKAPVINNGMPVRY